MKKLMLLAALLAMAVVAAVPAIAQVSQSNEQGVDSGDATQNFNVTGGGDNSNACQMVQGIDNTGNATNNVSVLQYREDGSEIELEDSGDATQNFNVTGGGANSNACQMVQGIDNTGNATSNTSVLQYANDGAGVGVSGGNFEISPTQNENVAKVCDQQVNQAASATGV